ncbi:L-threonine synthase [Escherichia coli]|nr:L-threonine synthase [Escherichia coli]
MKLYNLKDHNEQVSFAQAVTQGLGKNHGLFFPHNLPEFSLPDMDEMLKLDCVTRSAKILSAFIGDVTVSYSLLRAHETKAKLV